MTARNNYPVGAVQRQSEASRREIIFSFASVFVVSAFIYAVTYFVVRLPA
ncbi:hypothetical protein [Quatrionicoccus australiensis]|nr:hypothetical protein [Quatrionicoccus australiensis]UCV15357.1 hypothetical protein KI612_01190 [Quatrionicoccus australiensis]